ncbi:MAG: methyltransferase domain-containing protein [Tissierellia bacterium]|nr:methyltransferase domain-containing protein [Tissierellia bacterium]
MKWDANKYTNNFSFVHKYGEEVLKLLEIKPNMRVLDLGCGNGELTKKISDLGVYAIGVDSSEELLSVAKEKHPTIAFMKQDATNLVLDEPVDAVFSNAVFHWIPETKQAQMLRHIFETIKVGGQFVFEFGGYRNNQLIHLALERSFRARNLKYRMPFYFPTIAQFATRLEEAGFEVREMSLFHRFTELKGEDGLSDWINMFIKMPFQGVDAELKKDIIFEAVEDLRSELYQDERWYADYVRIRGKAVR